jgi:hypothetical protein
MMSVKV